MAVVQAQPIQAVAVPVSAVGQVPQQPPQNSNIKPYVGVTMATEDQQKHFEKSMKATFLSIFALLMSLLATVMENATNCDTCSTAGRSPTSENPCARPGEEVSPCSEYEQKIAAACAGCNGSGFVGSIFITFAFIGGLFWCTRHGPKERNMMCINMGLLGHGTCLYCSGCCGVILGVIYAAQCDEGSDNCSNLWLGCFTSAILAVSSGIAVYNLNKVKASLVGTPNVAAQPHQGVAVAVAQPVMAQPVIAQPVQAQPVQSQPVQVVPVQATPVQAEDAPPPYEQGEV